VIIGAASLGVHRHLVTIKVPVTAGRNKPSYVFKAAFGGAGKQFHQFCWFAGSTIKALMSVK
jgi:hypothetical protein